MACERERGPARRADEAGPCQGRVRPLLARLPARRPRGALHDLRREGPRRLQGGSARSRHAALRGALRGRRPPLPALRAHPLLQGRPLPDRSVRPRAPAGERPRGHRPTHSPAPRLRGRPRELRRARPRGSARLRGGRFVARSAALPAHMGGARRPSRRPAVRGLPRLQLLELVSGRDARRGEPRRAGPETGPRLRPGPGHRRGGDPRRPELGSDMASGRSQPGLHLPAARQLRRAARVGRRPLGARERGGDGRGRRQLALGARRNVRRLQGLVARIGNGPLASEGRRKRACTARRVGPRGGPSRLLGGRPLARLPVGCLALRRTLPLARAARAHRADRGQPALESRGERALLRRGGSSEGPALRGARGRLSPCVRRHTLRDRAARPPRSSSRPTAGASSSSRGLPAHPSAT